MSIAMGYTSLLLQPAGILHASRVTATQDVDLVGDALIFNDIYPIITG